ncbi:LysM peptidoglycan-binding domain-containing protein [Paenibacillus sp. GSMTC-2017]|uniref:LysM peptidoglycan-binding domain-containing protein n=1 Tax=Paenibacillus sp. GSMTC-2017 TaxID=2794350 RepID=UPI0018D685E0|nr:LysM peptidoglycan-binding domain-containing protein [Paenibacillus sp. GSMTC-2017]MBH5317774.1 LysM peptidoglycan-binding domain-containing protein [Paenibacillus sp. GSMTC-2017]
MIILNQGTYRSIHTESILTVDPTHKLTTFRLIKRHGAKIIVVLMIALLVFTSFLLMGTSASGTDRLQAEEILVTVSSGDTLWEIARRHASSGDDIGFIVYKIKHRNNLETVTIKPGQKLIIPNLN